MMGKLEKIPSNARLEEFGLSLIKARKTEC